ncbi:MAG: cobalamin-binding protein [Gemmataceae bacterium]|nr:cobalamin-binding protein [Gemmataceae bacterium]MDW8264300.1 cobalamin-binding protein [Gemmataceae bacterium]
MPRIVSLIASATEIVSALGFERDLVGRSHECDYPPSVQSLPVCTAANFPVEGSSREIDARVKAALREVAAVYRVDGDLLRELRPDVIVTQSQCEVCAVSLRDVERIISEWPDQRPRIVTLRPNCLEDVWDDIRRVASALDVVERGEELVAELKRRLAALRARSRLAGQRPTVACLEWLDPLMAAGNWVPELVRLAGGEPVVGQAGKHSPYLDWNDLQAADPEFLVLMPCGWGIDKTRTEADLLADQPGWSALRAVRCGQVYLTDGNQYFNRPGPRLVESAEILAEIVHPSLFRFGHEGTGWERRSSLAGAEAGAREGYQP